MRQSRPNLLLLLTWTFTLLAMPAAANAQGVLFVESDKVGIGIDTPTQLLHLKADGPGNTLVYIENTSGPTRVGSRYSSSITTWDFRMDGLGDFIFDNAATGGEELKIRQDGQLRVGPAPGKIVLQPNGDIEIEGSLFENSSRASKEAIEHLDGGDALAKVSSMEIFEWSYKDRAVRHIGPMAEDFHAIFGLGKDEKSLSSRDVASVALIALKGLHEQVQHRDAEIERLRSELDELRTMIEAMATASSSQTP